VWDSWAEKLEGKRIVHSFLPGGFPEPEDTTVEERAALLRQRLEKEPKLLKRWQKVNMLLKAAFGFPVEDDEEDESQHDEAAMDSVSAPEERKWRIVHATAAVKCHLSLFLLACALHPEQARELDESDLRLPSTRPSSAQGAGDARPTSLSHQTALHLAASSNAGGEPGKTVVISLLSLYREAAQEQDGIDGSLPLHRMVENPCKQDWPDHAAILYHFYPRAVQIPDHKGRFPLHRAAAAVTHKEREGEDAEQHSVIIQLVRTFPQAVSQADETGCLPFHLLAMNGRVWDDDVETVYNVHRNAVQMRAGPACHGRLPLHMAAANEKSRDSLIQRLVQLHPRAASLEDRQGKLPFHLACEQGKAWEDGLRRIHEAFPHAAQQAENNSRAWFPLHMAVSSPASGVELISKLVELHPVAAETPDSEGRYPMHLACLAGKSWAGCLETLFDANPETISALDSKGRLPIHIAALRYCKKEDGDGDIAERKPRKTRAVPAIKAMLEEQQNNKEAAELDILFNLLRADPTTVQSLS
jgi:ankyrin repeat protein